MNTDQNKNTENNVNQEIDLVYLFRKIGDFFKNIQFGIYRFISFSIKKIIWIAGIIILGVGLGYFAQNSRPQTYKHVAVVATNFDTAELLYEMVNQSSIANIEKVEVSPRIDLFNLAVEDEKNLRTLEFLNKAGMNLTKYKKGSKEEKLYRYHELKIYTKGRDEQQKVIEAYLDPINKNPYYINRQKVEYKNNLAKRDELLKSIEGINKIFNQFDVQKTAQVEVNSFDKMDELVKSKNLLLKQLNQLDVELTEQSKAVYPTISVYNLSEGKYSLMVTYPLIGLLLFYILSWFYNWYISIKKEYQSVK